jgi:AbiJ N-terminal domain 4
MSIFDIFSKRQKRLRGDVPDVYAYDSIPQPLKVQIIHIWRDTLGDENQYRQEYLGTRQAYQFIVDTLCREYGLFRLPHVKDEYGGRHYIEELGNYLLNESNPEKVLDAVELSFRYIDKLTRRFDYLSRQNASSVADEAIEELNLRFREHGIGYEYVDGEVVRIDSELIHAEVVKPALALLRGVEYEGAQAEFLKAHEHYRKGNDKEALAECLKSFESVMKVICARRGWAHDPNATSRALLQIVFDNELIPKFWEQHFSALRSSLESGVPTARNRLGGHGQGVAVIQVPTYLVAYVLHLTASAIVFLREADNAKP